MMLASPAKHENGIFQVIGINPVFRTSLKQMSEEIWPGYGHWAISGWADEGLRGAAVLTSLLRYGAALAMKCCSNAPHLRQAA
jgi:hypothetical protein